MQVKWLLFVGIVCGIAWLLLESGRHSARCASWPFFMSERTSGIAQYEDCMPGTGGGGLQHNLLWHYGSEIVIVLAMLVVISILLSSKLLFIGVVGAFLCSLYFFRNPERVCVAAEQDPRVIVCPADGTVVEIISVDDDFVGSPACRVSIFLSPLDVHVQWTPIAGLVKQVIYHPGEFLVAYAPKSSEVNERNDLYVQNSRGIAIVVRQIAGFIARRICCWVEEGEELPLGTRYGMIRFGSRVDIIMPESVTLEVVVGQRVRGGETVLGRITQGE